MRESNTNSDSHRDRFAERDRDEHAFTYFNADQSADVDRHRDPDAASQRDGNTRAYAHRDRDAHTGGT